MMSQERSFFGGCVLVLSFVLAGCSSNVDAGSQSAAPESMTVEDAPDETPTIESTTTEPAVEITSEASTTTEVEVERTAETNPEEEGVLELCGVDIEVLFDEGAPRDRITIVNKSPTASIFEATFDLSTSAGQIIFDTVEGGGGVEVFQDFQVEPGEATIDGPPDVDDGASVLTLDFSGFEPGETFAFSIDVDDQLVDSELGQIQVTGAEIEGATVTFIVNETVEIAGTFDASSIATAVSTC